MTYAVFDRNASNIHFSMNVGIGTATPQAPLHVFGDQYVQGNLGIGTSQPIAPLHLAAVTYAQANIGIGTSIPDYPLHVSATNNTHAVFIKQNATQGNALRVETLLSGGPALVVDRFGNVGIGTSTVTDRLRVQGTTPVVVQATGNVGIGVTNPQGIMEVKTTASKATYEFPPDEMTADSTTFINVTHGAGTYDASASSQIFDPYLAFDRTNGGRWQSASSKYNGTTGDYTGAVTTNLSPSGSVSGEWIQIKMPTNVTIWTYSIHAAANSSRGDPKSFSLLGSTDGSTWVLLNSQTGQSFVTEERKIYSFVNYTAYSYYRLVISSTTPISGDTFATVNELRFVGSIETPTTHLRVSSDIVYVPRANIGIGHGAPCHSLVVTSAETLDAEAAIVSGGEKNKAVLYFGTPFLGRHENSFKSAIIAEGQSDFGRSKLHFCVNGNNSISKSFNAGLDSSRMTIDFTGNVGIGTTAPTSKLRVEGGMDISGGIMPTACNVYDLGSSNYRWKDLYLSGNTIDLGGLKIQKSADTGGLQVVSQTNQPLDTSTQNLYATANIGIGTTTTLARVHVLHTGTGDIMRVDDSTAPDTTPFVINQDGNVGIGTTNPAEKLHVSGNIFATGTISASNLQVIGDFVTLNTITSNTEQMVISNAGTGPALIVSQTGIQPVAEFYDSDNTCNNPSFYIANDGLIGIGTASPQARAHLYYTGTGDIFRVDDSTAPDASPFIIKEDGNVGIGTVTPNSKFHVMGDLAVTYGNGIKCFTSSGNNFTGAANSKLIDVNWNGFDYVQFYTPGTVSANPHMTIISSGNVGIGTTVPLAKTHVYHDTAANTLRIQNGGSFEYPPVAMTANTTNISSGSYGLGTYVATQSSVYNNLNAYLAFNKTNVDSVDAWISQISIYDGSTGAYTGAVSTNGYSGEWCQIAVSRPIVVKRFAITSRNFTNRGDPKNFALFVSQDGANWSQLYTVTNASFGQATTNTYNINNSIAYNYYRLATSTITPVGGNTWVSIGQWQLYEEYEDSSVNASMSSLTTGRHVNVGIGNTNPQAQLDVYAATSQDTLEFPPKALLANTHVVTGAEYANGTYVASAYSVYSSDYPACDAFGKTNADSLDSWVSVHGSFNDTTGVYNGSGITGTYAGDWLQLQLPSAVTLKSYSVQARNFTGRGDPKSFAVFGSSDGSTWTQLNAQTNQVFTQNSVNTYAVTNSTAYTYYRLAIQTITPSAGAPFTTVGEWRLYGIPSAGVATLQVKPQQVIVPYANVGIGTTTPTSELHIDSTMNTSRSVTTVGTMDQMVRVSTTDLTPTDVSGKIRNFTYVDAKKIYGSMFSPPGSTSGSVYFNDSWVSMTSPISTNMITSDWTIETWIYNVTANNDVVPCVFGDMYTSGANTWSFGLDNGNRVAVYIYLGATGGWGTIRTTTTVALSIWTHIAVKYTASSRIMNLYINGVAQNVEVYQYSAPFSTSVTASTTNATIGNTQVQGDLTTNLMMGQNGTRTHKFYVSNLRFLYGTAQNPTMTLPLTSVTNTIFLLTASSTARDFTVTQSGAVGIGTTLPIPSTKLQVHGGISQYGGVASTVVPKDDSGTYSSLSHTGTVSASIFSPNANTGSVYYRGAGNYTTISGLSNANPINIYGADFIIEGWVYNITVPNTVGTNIPYLIGSMSATGGGNYWSFGVNGNNKVGWYAYLTAPTNGLLANIEGSTSIPVRTWTHIAVKYTASTRVMQLYVNGVAETLVSSGVTNGGTSVTFPSGTATSSTIDMVLGQYYNVSHAFFVTNLRVLIGTAQDPTTSLPLTSITNTKLLLRSDIPTNQAGLQVFSDGRVSIGNTNTLSPFTVSSASLAPPLTDASPQRDYTMQVFNNSLNVTPLQAAGIAFTIYGQSSPIGNQPNSPPGAAIVHEVTGAYSAGNLHFKTRGTTGATDPCITRMTITSDGNVGIGTTNPRGMIDVYKASSQNTQLYKSIDSVKFDIQYFSGGSIVYWKVASGVPNITYSWGYFLDISGHFSRVNQYLRMDFSLSTSGNKDQFFVTGSADIGNMTPNGQNILVYRNTANDTLDIWMYIESYAQMNATFRASGSILPFLNTTVSSTTAPTPSDTYILYYNLASHATITKTVPLSGSTSGYVGIGITTPQAKLHVNGGELRVTSTAFPIVGIYNETMTNTNTPIFLGKSISNNQCAFINFTHCGVDGATSNQMNLGLYGAPQTLALTGSGNVGIGMTNPSAKLHLRGGGMRITTSVNNSTARPALSTAIGSYEIRASSLDGDTYDDGFLRLSAGYGTAVQSAIDLSGYSTLPEMAQNIRMVTSGQERMRIISDGNVGIGITNPSYKLDVNGVIASRLTSTISGSNSDISILINKDTTGNNTAGHLGMIGWVGHNRNISNNLSAYISAYKETGEYDDTANLIFATSDGATYPVERMRVGRSGYVGIGTTNPQYHLHIHQPSGFTGVKFTNGFSTTKYLDVGMNSTGYFFAGYGDHPIMLWTNGAEKVRVDTNGNVGIGINAPTSKLHVNGSLSKTSGTFDIPHPTLANKRLIHSFIEGPRCDLIYRGEKQLVNGTCSIVIDQECTHYPALGMTRGTFSALTCNPMAFLQNKSGFARVRFTITDDVLNIECEDPSSTDTIQWMVVAERKDEKIKEWNRTDENGLLICEYDA